MELRIKTWLQDIHTSIEEIESFLPEKKDFFSFQSDLKTRKAVERNIEIIGEAVNRILKQDISITITNAKRIVGTRNRLAHEYDSISVEIIWTIVTKELPSLKEEVNMLLKHIIF
ncbi:MAG: DUF86 domain-containing protein [Flavobacterium sp.]